MYLSRLRTLNPINLHEKAKAPATDLTIGDHFEDSSLLSFSGFLNHNVFGKMIIFSFGR